MSGLQLKRLTGFAYGHDNQAPEVWVNPQHIAYLEPRVVARGCGREQTEGTNLYFQQDGGLLAVRESIGHVVALLGSRGGVCRDCYQPLGEAWMTLCDDCRRHRHNGTDHDPEQVALSLVMNP
jgi:hypothetical protein